MSTTNNIDVHSNDSSYSDSSVNDTCSNVDFDEEDYVEVFPNEIPAEETDNTDTKQHFITKNDIIMMCICTNCIRNVALDK